MIPIYLFVPLREGQPSCEGRLMAGRVGALNISYLIHAYTRIYTHTYYIGR